MVRSETGQKAAVIQSSGVLTRHDTEHKVELSPPDLSGNGPPTTPCDFDYPAGVEGTCTCTHTGAAGQWGADDLILDQDECVIAAAEAGVSTTILDQSVTPFAISSDWEEKRPKGCFKQTCAEDANKNCYFYNPIGNTPAKCEGTAKLADGSAAPDVTGTPICKRPRFLYGTNFSGASGFPSDGGCPAEYGVIMDRQNCSDVAKCLGLPPGPDDMPSNVELVTDLNQSRFDDFPMGCFINTGHNNFVQGKVYFNPPLENWLNPKNPVGQPICNVTVQQWWAASVHDVANEHGNVSADAGGE